MKICRELKKVLKYSIVAENCFPRVKFCAKFEVVLQKQYASRVYKWMQNPLLNSS